MKTGVVTGIILYQKALFEKDKRIEIYTPSHGKIVFLAKHAQSKSLKFGGKLDISNIVTIHFHQGKTFRIITQCDLIHHFSSIRLSYTKLLYASYILDLIRKTSDQEQENEAMYTLLEKALHYLNDNEFENFTSFLTHFHHRYLDIEGLRNKNNQVSSNEFKHIFEEYTGKRLMSVDNFIKG